MTAQGPDSYSRRKFLQATASVIGSAILPGAAGAGQKDNSLTLGYLPITDAAPLLVAHGKGFFADEGLDVPDPVMVRSWNVLTESFLAGKFDLTHMLFPIPVWMRFRQNYPAKVLAWDHTNGSAVTVHGDSSIRGFADLGGKQIAVPSWYSMHNLILQLGIRKKGLTPVIRPQTSVLRDDEVNLFILPPPEMPPALLGKKIDGFIVAEPFNALAEVRLKARIMRFTGDIWKNHPCCVVVTHERLINNRPAVIQKAMNALVRAQIWCTSNPDGAARLLSREGLGYLPVPWEVLHRVFMGYDLPEYLSGPLPRPVMHPGWKISRIGFQPYPFPSATEFIISQMAKTLVDGDSAFLQTLDPNIAAKELVDDRFVREALKTVAGSDVFFPPDMANHFIREEIIEID
ncbi:MAG: ABC transporter substrate-binding protein [Pseudomonadota bacterium]